MSRILILAAKASHTKILKSTVGQYSRYPVYEQEFWKQLFDYAKSPGRAAEVLDQIQEIENEPCIENDRVCRAVQSVKATAKLTLLSKK